MRNKFGYERSRQKFFKYLIEDLLALSSDEYLRSIEEARTDYKEGKVKYLEEIFDV